MKGILQIVLQLIFWKLIMSVYNKALYVIQKRSAFNLSFRLLVIRIKLSAYPEGIWPASFPRSPGYLWIFNRKLPKSSRIRRSTLVCFEKRQKVYPLLKSYQKKFFIIIESPLRKLKISHILNLIRQNVTILIGNVWIEHPQNIRQKRKREAD